MHTEVQMCSQAIVNSVSIPFMWHRRPISRCMQQSVTTKQLQASYEFLVSVGHLLLRGRQDFRDFLLIYNRMTEMCFKQCVNNLNYRELTNDESVCVERCVSKSISVNHKMMSIYMEVQPEFINRSLQNAQQQMAPEQPQQTEAQNPS